LQCGWLYSVVYCRKHSRKRRSSPSPVRSRRRYSFIRSSLFLSCLPCFYFSLHIWTLKTLLWYYHENKMCPSSCN
jgi:hypothetical protein